MDYEKEERKAIQEEQKPEKAKRKRQSKKPATGWTLESYKLEDKDGKLSPVYPPMVFSLKAKNLKQAMSEYQSLAEHDPDKVANCLVRIVEVHSQFKTKVRQVVDIC